jgi:integrase
MALLPRHVDRFVQAKLATVSERTHKPLSPTYVRSMLTTLRMALAQAVRRREVPDNAAADATAPTVTPKRVEALTDDEADAIRDATAETWIGPFVVFMLGSGLRPGEAVGLNQGDLHLNEGYVSLRESKTTIRAVPLSDDAIEAARTAVKSAPRIGTKEPVFFGPKSGERLTVWSATHAIGRVTERLGTRLTAHGLRHGAATIALAHGASLRHVQEQLGHRSPRMTARYAHVIPEQQRETAKLLNRRSPAR